MGVLLLIGELDHIDFEARTHKASETLQSRKQPKLMSRNTLAEYDDSLQILCPLAIGWHHPTETFNYFDRNVVHKTKERYEVSQLLMKALPWDELGKAIVCEFVVIAPIVFTVIKLLIW